MRRTQALLIVLFVACSLKAFCTDSAPLKLVATYEFPGDIKGNFDHLTVDVRGHRLFATPQEHKSVEVIDLRSGKWIHSIPGIEVPHALLYRQDLDRLYVTDGKTGDLKIFSGKTYKLIKSVELLVGADNMGYDPATKYLYIVTGGKEAQMTFSTMSVVDTTSGTKINDIRIDGETVEASVIEKSSSRIYVNNRTKNRVEVIDRNTRQILAGWPMSLGNTAGPIALDEANHRLFVACRSGQIVVFDTETGKELQALPIGGRVDDLAFDAKSKRLYAACGAPGTVDVYEETDPDHYRSLGKVPTGPVGKNGWLVPELNRYFVPVPRHENKNAEVLVYQVE